MKYYLGLMLAMAAILLGLFVVADHLEISLLTNPLPWLTRGGWLAASTGVGLLVGDVLLPVPSSLVMIANGAVFGVVLGAALSLVGSLGAAWLGFWIGRRGGPLLERFVPAEEQRRGKALLNHWGGLAVVVSRPVPILAESVAILAGASALSWSEMSLAALIGSLPAAIIYAVSGALASGFDQFVWVFLVVLLVAGPLWVLGRRARLNMVTERAAATEDPEEA